MRIRALLGVRLVGVRAVLGAPGALGLVVVLIRWFGVEVLAVGELVDFGSLVVLVGLVVPILVLVLV